ncbi:MAG: imidazole glycerol phosphate synthase subunit HisH [Lachnospiraceae bacterium]|nr:imidazole glycerol phosphate synthase subunit HisH [Lachnospiraceae bacterium]
MVSIIDYDAGNTFSVEKAVLHLERECRITRDRDEILSADHVILPGVGCFADCMEHLKQFGLDKVIREVVSKNIPLLGICLGLQLMFESSEESPGVEGLGLLPGKVCKIPDDPEHKVPQIGWNSITFPKESRLFSGIDEGSYVYFVHSYYLKASDESDVAAVCDYGVNIHAAVERGNVFATQFHPEKSGEVGLAILSNFLSKTK